MRNIKPIHYKLLRKKINVKDLPFKTTTEVASLAGFIGQERALEALNFGIGIKSHGYNMYAMGPSGIGKRSLIRTVLALHASQESAPPDWCYIYNFEAPEKPIALALPAGIGYQLQQDMKHFIEELSSSLLAVFESDEYNARLQEIIEDFNLRREKINKKSLDAPTSDKIPHLYKERHKKEKDLELRFTYAALEPMINRLKKKYTDLPQIITYLEAVEKDINANVSDFIKRDELTNILSFAPDQSVVIKYQINLLVDNSTRRSPPIIFEENPSYSNLISRVEHSTHLGAFVTNFMLIKPGSLHLANGGYLVIEARKLKKEKHAWEALKRCLYTKKIRIEPIEHVTDTVRPVSLEPIPIPLNIKIILLGERPLYYSLCYKDPEFTELFKVAVDFDDQIPLTKHNLTLYAKMISTIIQREGLRPFHASAVASLLEYSIRLVEDVDKLSTHIRNIDDLILEADYWASQKQKKVVEAADVERAIEAQTHRMDRSRERYYEDIIRQFILINTKDLAIGQANCLSVVKVGNFSYGHPTKITAKIRIGKDKFIDIQRVIKLAGPMHTKAGLIISNFLAGRYSLDKPFSLAASISFEQIYGHMDGDSASVAEICALLSVLANVPLKQYLAVTGSVNQYGEVQAVGGLNEKIEGFFDICNTRGLTGKQGVIIPHVNIKNLMLKPAIVKAAKANQFCIYPIKTIDQAVFLLTGLPAGERNAKGVFPIDSVNYKVEERLSAFAKSMRRRS